MADNKQIPAQGTGSTTPTIATDEIAGVDYQRVKVVWGVDGVATDTSASNPVPTVQTGALPAGTNNIGDVDVLTLPAVSGTVTANIGTVGTLATEATQTAQSTLYGAVTETAPASDTASSGLNGRLQRIAQRLTSLIALLPASLGQKTMANGLAVTIASDQTVIPISDNAGSITVDGTVTTTPPANASTNLAQVAGATVAQGHGTAASALRVELPTDGTGTVVLAAGAATIGALTANQSINNAQVAGTTVDTNSGNKSAGTQRVVIATDQVQLTNALKVDGSAVTQPVSMATPTSGGVSVSRLLAGASTNATSVKSSAGQVYGWHLANAAAYTVFFKLYNKASAPTVGTDTPFMTIPIPAGAAANVEFSRGVAMGTGIAFATTKLVADADTTVLVANDLVINLLYA